MKKKYLLIIIISAIIISTLSVSFSIADDEDEGQTWIKIWGGHKHHVTNGKTWRQLDTQAKITQLIGYEEGTSLLQLELLENKVSENVLSSVNFASDHLMISGFRFSDLVEQIDTFYSDSANLRIPVIEAYRYILARLKGVSPEELGRRAAKLRKQYNQ